MRPEDMTPSALTEWMRLDSPAPEGILERIDFNGLTRIPFFADELLAVA